MVVDNGGHHIEHILQTFLHYLNFLNEAMIRNLGVVLKLIVFFP